MRIMITGLKGGHSGLDIIQGRANAIKLLGRTLKRLEKVDYSLCSLSGGSLRNAIPREAEALVMLKNGSEKEAEKITGGFEKSLLNEYKKTDSGLKIVFKKSDSSVDTVFTQKFKTNVINLLLTMPHGVIAMSQDIPDLVETSTNLAVINTEGGKLNISTSQRSSIDSAKDYIASSVKAALELAGGNVTVGDGYPGWKPDMESTILKTSKDVFKELFNKEPEIKAIHAGLECGILGSKKPGLDMISFGPTIEGAHSPDERVNIATVEKFYELLKGILKQIAESK